MKHYIYEVGKQTIAEWFSHNSNPEWLTLVGRVDFKKLNELSQALVEHAVVRVDIGDLEVYVEDSVREEFSWLLDDSSDWGEMFDDLLYGKTDTGELNLSILERMLYNRQFASSFIIRGDYVTSLDTKVLVQMPPSKDVAIPEGTEIIGNGIFWESKETIQSLSIPDTVRHIGTHAFDSGGRLFFLEIPDSVVSLGESAFENCDIQELRLSNNLCEIPDFAFDYNFITDIDVPGSVKRIGGEAFSGSCYRGNVRIFEGVEEIECEAFAGPPSRVELPSTLKKISSDFYYKSYVDDPNKVPYVEVSPLNPIFFSKDGTLYFRKDGSLALDASYK